jgi:hypothetical protein
MLVLYIWFISGLEFGPDECSLSSLGFRSGVRIYAALIHDSTASLDYPPDKLREHNGNFARNTDFRDGRIYSRELSETISSHFGTGT